jgi:hypothetical protein
MNYPAAELSGYQHQTAKRKRSKLRGIYPDRFNYCYCKPAPRGLPFSFMQLRTLYEKVCSWRTVPRSFPYLYFYRYHTWLKKRQLFWPEHQPFYWKFPGRDFHPLASCALVSHPNIQFFRFRMILCQPVWIRIESLGLLSSINFSLYECDNLCNSLLKRMSHQRFSYPQQSFSIQL